MLSLWRRMHARQGAMARPGRRIRGEEWVPTNLPCSVPGKALRWAGRRWAAHPGGTNFGGESGSTNFEAASTVVNVPARAGTGGETTLRWRLASRLIYRPGWMVNEIPSTPELSLSRWMAHVRLRLRPEYDKTETLFFLLELSSALAVPLWSPAASATLVVR